MSRADLKELGEHLDAGQAGLVVVGVSDMGAKIEAAMRRAEEVKTKQLKADTQEMERDARPATPRWANRSWHRTPERREAALR